MGPVSAPSYDEVVVEVLHDYGVVRSLAMLKCIHGAQGSQIDIE
jgi:hypothetical protein